MTGIGDNKPPSMIETARSVGAAVGGWLEDHPVVDSEETAREAKLQVDRAKLCVADMEAERERQVRPLNTQVREINDSYKPAKVLLGAIIDEINRRITSFLAKEEAKRIKAAEEARKAAEAAEKAAKEAEQRERDAIDDANHGAIVDVATQIAEADAAFADYQRAERQAALTARDAHVKVGGGFTRSLSLRNKETLVLTNPGVAMLQIGMTPDIEAAILKGARVYRTMYGELPQGVESRVERSV